MHGIGVSGNGAGPNRWVQGPSAIPTEPRIRTNIKNWSSSHNGNSGSALRIGRSHRFIPKVNIGETLGDVGVPNTV